MFKSLYYDRIIFSDVPVKPSLVSTALATSCLIFESGVISQEKTDIFHEENPFTASLQ